MNELIQKLLQLRATATAAEKYKGGPDLPFEQSDFEDGNSTFVASYAAFIAFAANHACEIAQQVAELELQRDRVLICHEGSGGRCFDCRRLLGLDSSRPASEEWQKYFDLVNDRDALKAENERLKESMVRHFNEEHLAGDGPEIDRWKAHRHALAERLRQADEIISAYRFRHDQFGLKHEQDLRADAYFRAEESAVNWYQRSLLAQERLEAAEKIAAMPEECALKSSLEFINATYVRCARCLALDAYFRKAQL